MSVLEVRNIRKNFEGNEVLKGIDFSMEKGEVLSIIGSSGSGKTTLLRCLNFLETPDTGEILVDGETVFSANDTRKLTPAERQNRQLRFGMVFQSFNLFPQYSVKKNLTLAAALREKRLLRESGAPADQVKAALTEIDRRAEELLATVGLWHKADVFPSQLSGGQQQRVAIARALMLSPEILCFDEPTSALDPELTGEVLRVIKSLKGRDRTMIIVTHEMSFARSVSDQVIFMADGVIEEKGAPEALFAAPRSEKTRAFLSHSAKNEET